jgi:hypothetical protein
MTRARAPRYRRGHADDVAGDGDGALVALGCGGRAATTTPAAPPGVSLAGLLGGNR